LVCGEGDENSILIQFPRRTKDLLQEGESFRKMRVLRRKIKKKGMRETSLLSPPSQGGNTLPQERKEEISAINNLTKKKRKGFHPFPFSLRVFNEEGGREGFCPTFSPGGKKRGKRLRFRRRDKGKKGGGMAWWHGGETEFLFLSGQKEEKREESFCRPEHHSLIPIHTSNERGEGGKKGWLLPIFGSRREEKGRGKIFFFCGGGKKKKKTVKSDREPRERDEN